ncbi:MAG TPA: hypothetical protein VLH18_03940 [Candidatus Limnocylindrales bacterium]|nr:hypothetical protein [Candidatus Limnocylindrales bacterium]
MGKKVVETRILTYVAGLLHFYGVMQFDDLYRAVHDKMPEILDRVKLRKLLEKTVLDDDSPYVFDGEDDFFFDIEVDDVEWVLDEQSHRSNVPFRPVSAEEAESLLADQYTLLWSEAETKFYEWLIERGGFDPVIALATALDYAGNIKNGLSPMELMKMVSKEILLENEEELGQAISLVMEFANHIPQWTLKGWRPTEILAMSGN